MKVIAHIETDFPQKFGVPRQSGIAEGAVGKIVFEPEYRAAEAFRGLEEYSHLWIIWEFSLVEEEGWHPTVRPPRLGGNKRVGVFATRSPYRPNPIGLSSVKIEKTEVEKDLGPVIYVSGVDMTDGTPIYDIKPYLPYTDCHPDAVGGFADNFVDYSLEVCVPLRIRELIPQDKLNVIIDLLAKDPRPSYQNDVNRVYGMKFSDFEVKFRVGNGCVYVEDIIPSRE